MKHNKVDTSEVEVLTSSIRFLQTYINILEEQLKDKEEIARDENERAEHFESCYERINAEFMECCGLLGLVRDYLETVLDREFIDGFEVQEVINKIDTYLEGGEE